MIAGRDRHRPSRSIPDEIQPVEPPRSAHFDAWKTWIAGTSPAIDGLQSRSRSFSIFRTHRDPIWGINRDSARAPQLRCDCVDASRAHSAAKNCAASASIPGGSSRMTPSRTTRVSIAPALAAPVGRLDAKRPRGFNVLRPRNVTSSPPRAKTVLAARQCTAASMSRRILPPGLTRAIEP